MREARELGLGEAVRVLCASMFVWARGPVGGLRVVDEAPPRFLTPTRLASEPPACWAFWGGLAFWLALRPKILAARASFFFFSRAGCWG